MTETATKICSICGRNYTGWGTVRSVALRIAQRHCCALVFERDLWGEEFKDEPPTRPHSGGTET